MATYYVSAVGNDASSGRSTQLPWKTIAKVRAKILDGTISRRDVVLFKRGERFPGRWNVVFPGGLSDRRLFIGTYGDSKRRAIWDGYKYANIAAGWTMHAAGVWKIDLTGGETNSGAYTGDTGAPSCDAGFLKINGTIRPNKKFTLAELAQPWDFYSEGAFTYVKASANPTTLAADIRISVDGPMISTSPSLEFSGIECVGTGGHGMNIGYGGSIRYWDMFFRECGGSRLGASGTLRYGNGIEIAIGTSDIVGEAWIEDVYDVAYTLQGDQASGGGIGWSDIYATIHDKNCNQSFEFWARGTDTTSVGAGFNRVVCSGGSSINPGHSWAQDVRSDAAGRGCPQLLYTHQLPVDITIEDHDFVNPRTNYLFCSNPSGIPAGYKSRNNRIYMPAGMPMQYQRAETIEQFDAWRAATGMETGSQVFYLPTLPTSPAEALEALTSVVAFTRAQKPLTDLALSRVRNELRRVDQQTLTRTDAMWPRQVRIDYLGRPLSASAAFTSYVQNNAYWFSGSLDNGAGALDDEVVWEVPLAAGTYTMDLFHRTGPNRGIYTLQLDGVEFGTIDGYETGANNRRTTVPGFTVLDNGTKKVKVKMASKNAASSGYVANISALIFLRTGN